MVYPPNTLWFYDDKTSAQIADKQHIYKQRIKLKHTGHVIIRVQN